jgi:4-hydroxy-tetrahydrodipicolinate reductase
MTKVIISGIGGRMGKVLWNVIKDDPEFSDFEVVAGFDQFDGDMDGAPVFSQPDENPKTPPRADVVIDFSNYAFVPVVLRYCTETKTPAVIATTALGGSEFLLMNEASEKTPVFHSSNMSLGINLVAKMSQLAAPAVESSFSIEIVETHHNKKKDAPSGTAILLADAINKSLEMKKEYIYGRYGREEQPDMAQIGIHAVRGGTIPGRHTVMFAGPDEVIEITHTAYSSKVFAIGALKAASFVIGKPPGLYDMNSLIG